MLRRYRAAWIAVRASYPAVKRQEEARSDLPAALLYRPVSMWVAPLFILAGWSADAVSVLGIIAALALPAVAWWSGPFAWVWVVLLCLGIQVLDCVDGTVARVRARSSPVGPMLDSIGSLLGWTAYFVAVGALAQAGARAAGYWHARGGAIGLGLAVLYLAQRQVEDTFEAYLGERVQWDPLAGAQPGRASRWAPFGRLAEQTLAFGGLGVAGALGKIPWFLAGLAGYQIVLLTLWLRRLIGRTLARRAASVEKSWGS